MLALTLWQPYASLIALGAKPYETRGWATRYRGDLVIHAAAKRDRDVLDAMRQPDIRRAFSQPGHDPRVFPLPFGVGLCIVTLVDCVPTWKIPPEERVFGDFSDGRFAWKLENVRLFDEPIPAKGMQGLWEWKP